MKNPEPLWKVKDPANGMEVWYTIRDAAFDQAVMYQKRYPLRAKQVRVEGPDGTVYLPAQLRRWWETGRA